MLNSRKIISLVDSILSKTLAMISKRLMGLWLRGSVRSLPFLGMKIMFEDLWPILVASMESNTSLTTLLQVGGGFSRPLRSFC